MSATDIKFERDGRDRWVYSIREVGITYRITRSIYNTYEVDAVTSWHHTVYGVSVHATLKAAKTEAITIARAMREAVEAVTA